MRVLAASVAMVLAIAVVAGQETPRFDAASIKPNRSGGGNISVHSTANQLRAENVSVLWLIRDAYQVQEFQISGAPAWAARDKFDIVARTEQTTGDQYRPMLRSLLDDRFALVTHRQTMEAPVYVMGVARPGRRGPGLKTSRAASCDEAERSGQFCGFDVNNTVLHAGTVRMDEVAARISEYVGRTVIDRTGLAGVFDLDLTWTSDARRPPAAGDSGPSIFTALQEQLGLTLHGERGPVEMLVIDRVEPPTEN
jgi:uncharacterized protein (TIGR03435 family)